MSLFDGECLRIYTESGMVSTEEKERGERERGGREGGGEDDKASPSSGAPPSPASSSADAADAVTLAASPEDEAEVYLEAGPLGAEAGRRLGSVTAPVLVAAGGGGRGGGKGGGGSSSSFHGSEENERSDSPHDPLASAAPRTARLLPRGKLEVYRGLGHLGPFEDPAFVGERAAEAFRRALDMNVVVVDDGSSRRTSGKGGCCCSSWCRVCDDKSWDSLPDRTELESIRDSSKL